MPVELETPAAAEAPVAESIPAVLAETKKNQPRRVQHKKFRPASEGVARKKLKLSGSTTVDLNCAEASVHGNWRKTKWQ